MNLFESIYRKFLTKNHRVPDQHAPNQVSTKEKTTITHNINQVENEYIVSDWDPFSIYGTNVGANIGIIQHDLLIRRWRAFSNQPEAAQCLDEILNEAINPGDDGEWYKIDLSKVEEKYETNSSQPLIEDIRDSHEKFKMLLNFDENIDNLFLQFMIDGQINCEAIYPKSQKEMIEKGIVDAQIISPIGLRRIKIRNPQIRDEATFIENNREYLNASDAEAIYKEIEKDESGYDEDREYVFYYYDKSSNQTEQDFGYNSHSEDDDTIIFDDEQIISANSGKWDSAAKIYLSPIQRAIRSLNHIQLIEDSIVIFAITKANQKRMFKVNTGGMNRKTSDQYVEMLKNKYSQKKFYNSSTGEISDRKVTQTINEDFWVSVKDGQASLEVVNVEGVANASFETMEELNYFRRKARESFGIPITRLNSESNTTYLGYDSGAATINRDEEKFSKQVHKYLIRLMELEYEFIRRDLVAKRIIGTDDWYYIKQMIRFVFTNENNYVKIKKLMLLEQQLTLLERIDPWREKGYYSKKYIERELLGRTEEEIEKMRDEIEEEIIEADVRIESQERMLEEPGFGGGGGGYSGGFTPLPSSAGEIGGDVFPEGFGEVPENEPEMAPEPETPEEAPTPEELNQSVKETKRHNLILETLKKYSDKVPENGFVTIDKKRFKKSGGIFIPV
jgi:hypothetical protein